MLPMMMMPLLAMLQNPTEPLRVHDGGVCGGLSWIRLEPGESGVAEHGPDFTVYRFEGPGDRWWGVYGGNWAQVKGNGPLLLA